MLAWITARHGPRILKIGSLARIIVGRPFAKHVDWRTAAPRRNVSQMRMRIAKAQ